MSTRKRTPKNPTAETPTAVAEPPAADITTAVAEPPAAEPRPDGQSFAERVGQKKWTAAPDPFGIAKDNVAGVRLFESKQDRQMAIKFGEGAPEDRPSQAVIDRMKEAGYRWNPADRIWATPVRPDSATATRIDAEKLYQEVRQMIREEKGIEATPDMPFQREARMTVPVYNLRDLGPQAQQMANHCNNERLAMTLQYVAIGSMIVMAAATAAQIIKDLLHNSERHGRSR